MKTPEQIKEINRVHKALALLKRYSHQDDDGWPYVSVEYHGIYERATIVFFYVRGRVREEFTGDTFDDGMERLEEMTYGRDFDEVPF